MKSRAKGDYLADVKTEDNAVHLVDLASSSELKQDLNQAFQNVQEAMFKVCAMHTIDFRDLLEDHELPHGSVSKRS